MKEDVFYKIRSEIIPFVSVFLICLGFAISPLELWFRIVIIGIAILLLTETDPFKKKVSKK